MEGSRISPFPAAADVPLHRNPPLAPSQELAYRNKCIQLKRRLTEIETNNDSTRKRIALEKERVQKMRLLRAVLLSQLKDIMETPGKKLTAEQLEKLGITENGEGEDGDLASVKGRLPDDTLLDDSSDVSEEEIPEPSDRPTRTRRQNNAYRETVLSTNHPTSTTPNAYRQPGLPNLAPASSYSPAAPREPSLMATSAPNTVAPASPPYHVQQTQYVPESRYPPQSSPVQVSQSLYRPSGRSSSLSQSQTEGNGLPPTQVYYSQPHRPKPPVEQFCDHMRPQLEADNYPQDQIQPRIDKEWRDLSAENRLLWDERYNDQMIDYQSSMDHYKRAQRRGEIPGPLDGPPGYSTAP